MFFSYAVMYIAKTFSSGDLVVISPISAARRVRALYVMRRDEDMRIVAKLHPRAKGISCILASHCFVVSSETVEPLVAFDVDMIGFGTG